jgi:NADH dehydrogenase
LATARLAGRLRHQRVALTLVNAADVFVERLRLHQFAANQTLKKRPIADVLHGTGVTFIQGQVTHLDPERRELVVQTDTGTQRLNYDYLLYALGSTIERDSVPGLREYAYTLTPSGPLSASALREGLPLVNHTGGRVVVCGGGATGVEAAAEFAEAYPRLRVHLITRDEFGMFLGESVAVYLRQTLTRLGVTIQDHTSVTAVTAHELVADTGVMPFDVCVWAGGFAVPSLARESGLVVNERGQILIDPVMRSVSHPAIYAVGDAACPIEDPGVRVRMSAFTATIMGAHGADCLSATLRGHSPQPLSFAYLGQGIALGRHTAIGFGNGPDDVPHAPYFTGRVGLEVREFFVRYLADASRLERRWPGFFFWTGRQRYAESRCQLREPDVPVERSAQARYD